MNQLTSKPFVWLQRFALGCIIGTAALLLLLRLCLPFIDACKHHLADWLGAYLDTPVAIQHIKADLQGFGVLIDLQGITLGPADDALHLKQAAIELGYHGFRLNLDRLQLKLTRKPDGRFVWHGVPLNQSSDQPFALPSVDLVLRDATLIWHDQKYQVPPLEISGVQLALRQSAGQIKLRGRLDNQSDNPLGTLTFAADMQPDLSRGKAYLDWRNAPLAQFAATYLPDAYSLQTGRLDTVLWQHWSAGSPVQTQGRVALADVQPGGSSDVHQLQTKFDLRLSSNGAWRLGLADFRLNDQTPLGGFSVHSQPDAAGSQLDIALEHLDIAPMLNLIRLQPDLLAFQDMASPTGRLHDVRAKITLDADRAVDHWLLNAGFAGLSTSAWRHIPGIRGLQGELAIQPDQARIRARLQDSQFEFARLFDQPIQVKQLSTTLFAVADTPDQWRIQTDSIQLDTIDFNAEGRLRLVLAAGKPPHLDTRFSIARMAARQVKHYVSTKLVEPELTEWLDMALLEGDLEQIQFLLSGPVDTFPYHETRNGAFEVISKVRDLKLGYQKGWPVLDVDNGLVHFYQNSMRAKLFAGGLYDSRLTGEVHIESLDPTSSLIAQGQASGPLQNILRLLKEDALEPNFGQIADAMQIRGEGDTVLNLSVPLVSGRGAFEIQGRMRFADSQLYLKDVDLTAQHIHGELVLDQALLRAQAIRASVLGAPVRIDVQPESNNNQIKVSGRLDAGLIQRLAPGLPFDRIQGATRAVITLDLPGLSRSDASGKMALRVASNLHGMQIDLPAPLGKPAHAKRPIQLALSLSEKAAPVHVRYADALRAVIAQDAQRAAVHYNTGKPLLPEQGYHLDARLDMLNLADWQTFIQTLPARQGRNAPWRIRLTSNNLDYQGVHLTHAVLHAGQDADSLRGQLDSDQIKGNFFYAQNTAEPVSIHLDKAHITWEKSEGEQPLPEDFGPDPRVLPAIRLICEDFRVNAMPLGKLIVDSRKTDRGLQINKLLVAGQHLSLNSQGGWLMQEIRPVTRLQGKFHAHNLGNFLDAMGFARNVHKADTDLIFDLNWPGHPVQVRKETIAGSAQLSMQDGRLSELEPGLVKVLGLLNLDVLGRRLRLNFDDLLQKGYSFDAIKGDFTLAEGNANTRNVQVLGPTSHIQIGGRIGYIERDFDALVYVTPELDGTLLLAGVLAGGPVVGLGALLAQQLLDGEINELSRFEYNVTGSWDDPKLEPLQASATPDSARAMPGGDSADATQQRKQMIGSETDKPGLLKRLLEEIQSGEVDHELIDDPQFEEAD